MNLIECLAKLADQLDESGYVVFADRVDTILEKCAQYTDWDFDKRQKEKDTLLEKLHRAQITQKQYKEELKKLDQQAAVARNPHLEQQLFNTKQQLVRKE